jgi:hypothetical protein
MAVELSEGGGGEFRPYARESWKPTTPEGQQQFRDAVLQSIGPDHLDEMLPLMISLHAGLAAQRRLVGRAHDEYADTDLRTIKASSFQGGSGLSAIGASRTAAVAFPYLRPAAVPGAGCTFMKPAEWIGVNLC